MWIAIQFKMTSYTTSLPFLTCDFVDTGQRPDSISHDLGGNEYYSTLIVEPGNNKIPIILKLNQALILDDYLPSLASR